MKKTILLIGILLTTFLSCSQKEVPTLTPLQQLPKATKVGANTAGCLVNGEAFLPKGHFSTGNLTCYFINQNNFSLIISERDDSFSKSIVIGIDSLTLKINKIINLDTERTSDSRYGEFIISNINDSYSTTSETTGELVITHHDYDKAIISGTFWFDAVNNAGEKVEVREGRFDMKY
ncbi:DUF6252 family protein [Tenacibaculum maritimum]|uniref:DUF6252 family protein n=1 Tax=Tenacibaculum maritimum TaxID=107401 RepID=UPI0012E5A125|nr:DUF6252 family protein [Tenacibaculum maritimum]MCD9564070.1 DUF6252 family protein [Tenacibaculum maritimum]MCD9565576.1 DUF6252 family protein [Tenacibaculum maritimum]MCD9579199.1 DUF6252 family protein [Tenacibaculum maritimum]MCD9596077.1 DUF6252 family protein [Tenacibaculum maritimum]MCD9613326.1 DUF6252 family protein [Tenacibaculum maritimum]